MSVAGKLWCSTVPLDSTDDSDSTLSASKITVPLHQEDGKKSSFLLDVDKPWEISKPASVRISHRTTKLASTGAIFFLGGFQIVSNARTCEVYLTDKDGKEEYLTTSKGIPFEKGKSEMDWYKAMCVIPGGPRPVLELHIKLLSLKPNGEPLARLKIMKVTARLPEATAPSEPTAAQAEVGPAITPVSLDTMGGVKIAQKSTTLPAATESGINKDDLGAAMAGLSLLARSTEAAIESSMNDQFEKLEQHFKARFVRFEQHTMSLTSVIVSQKTALEKQQELLFNQQSILQEQNARIQQLLEEQISLKQSIDQLRTSLVVNSSDAEMAGRITNDESGIQQSKAIDSVSEEALIANIPGEETKVGSTELTAFDAVRACEQEDDNDISSAAPIRDQSSSPEMRMD